MIVEYRSPMTGEHRVQQIIARLTAAETMSATLIAGKLIVGIPMCLVGPLFVSAIVQGIVVRLSRAESMEFWIFLLPTSCVLIPLLMWLERRHNGEFLSDAMQGETSPLSASSYGEFEMQRTKIGWYLYTEIALLGPRLIWNVIDQLRGRTIPSPQVRAMAAQIVVKLLDAGEGMPLGQMSLPMTCNEEIRGAVAYLRRLEWIDVSSHSDRVWLPSSVRTKLLSL